MTSFALGRRLAWRRAAARFTVAALTAAELSVVWMCATLPAQNQAHDAGSYRIAGTVLNGTTGEPVQRALVSVMDMDNHTVGSMITDEQGQFSFGGLAAAKYPLMATKRGYQTALYDDHEGYNTAIVTGPDQDTTHLVFFLAPGSVLHGVVSADGGDPVEGASVMLFQRPHEPGEGTATFHEDTQTDDTGAYEFGGLAEGEYLIAVSAHPWYAMHRASGNGGTDPAKDLDVAYPVTYFDSTTEEASATAIAIGEGAREEADIHLHAVPALTISVNSVKSAEGRLARPELQQVVFGRTVFAESVGFMDALKTGTADFNGVAPGYYELTFGNPRRIVDLDPTANAQVEADAGSPAVSVTGILRTPNGAGPMEGQMTLRPAAGAMSRTTLSIPIRNGRFRFDAVAPGNWSFAVGSNGATVPILSVATGKGVQAGDEITVRDQPLEVTLTLGEHLGRVEGFAKKDGKGLGGTMVVLVPADQRQLESLARRDQSDSDGSFLLRDVVPGRYTVVAIEDGWKLNWSQPGVLARYLPGGTAVTVHDNSETAVHLAAPVVVEPR
jgi:Carboxypeptidase regulatory-like domain